MGDFQHARVHGDQPHVMQALPLSSRIHAVVGTAVTVIQRPGNARYFVGQLTGTANDTAFIRPGDYLARTFVDADVSVANDTIDNGSAHGFSAGDGAYRLTNSGGALPAGLALATDYFVAPHPTDGDLYYLSLSEADARKVTAGAAPAGLVVDITAAAGGGTHTVNGIAIAVASATNEDGQEALQITVPATGGPGQAGVPGGFVIAAPAELTVVLSAAGTVLTYYWLP